MQILDSTNLMVIDEIHIIPNHSCSCANMNNYLVGYRGDKIVKIIHIDVREFSKKPVF